ncbi:MAG: DUF1906 domain-containing protein [Actinomycetota bacterium]|nr:DUF1906 domain-containing protein [Actinomycetota bacterium]
MTRARIAALCTLAAAASVVGALLVAGPVSADPATTVRYPRAGATTTYSGLAFDTCTAPDLTTMRAWKRSPYRGIGVYIGGVNRGCDQPELTAGWVSTTTRMGWRLLPIYVGRQPRCGGRSDHRKIHTPRAGAEGRQAAANAVERARRLGMRPGSAVYLDIEHYAANVRLCRTGVLRFVSGWTRGLHRRGFLAGVYAHQDSGALHLAQSYTSTHLARPDALWIARWDRSEALRGWPTVPDGFWARAARAKQYRGDHIERWGGVSLNIDNDRLSAPVATVGRSYTVRTRVRTRTGPARRYRAVRALAAGTTVAVVCQARGRRAGGSRVWDKLTGGRYVPDAYVRTPARSGFSRAIPRCRYSFQVRDSDGASVHRGPRRSRRVVGLLPEGALARVECQRRGSRVGRTRVWNRLGDGRWVSDRDVATPGGTGFTRAVPRC